MEVFFIPKHKQNGQLRQNIFRSIRDVGRLVSEWFGVARASRGVWFKKGSREKTWEKLS